MRPKLGILLQIQDLKAQQRELAEGASERQVQEEEFNLDPETVIASLHEKVVELEGELDPHSGAQAVHAPLRRDQQDRGPRHQRHLLRLFRLGGHGCGIRPR